MLVWGLIGCGGTQKVQVHSEFTDEDTLLFDDAVDLVEDPSTIQGGWGDVQGGLLQRRVDRSDFIAVMRVSTFHTDTDLDRRQSYRLQAQIKKRLFGRGPKEIALRVREGNAGFHSVRVAEDRLLGDPFVVYVKWYLDENMVEPKPHWHLSPATPAVLDRTRSMLGRHRAADQTDIVVVHEPGR